MNITITDVVDEYSDRLPWGYSIASHYIPEYSTDAGIILRWGVAVQDGSYVYARGSWAAAGQLSTYASQTNAGEYYEGDVILSTEDPGELAAEAERVTALPPLWVDLDDALRGRMELRIDRAISDPARWFDGDSSPHPDAGEVSVTFNPDDEDEGLTAWAVSHSPDADEMLFVDRHVGPDIVARLRGVC